jgi:hypothetical protein
MLSLKIIFPEIFLLSMICIILLTDLACRSRRGNLVYYLSQLYIYSILP